MKLRKKEKLPQGSIRRKHRSEWRSSSRFWIGVPVRHHRRRASMAYAALAALVLRDLMLCASSRTTRSHSSAVAQRG
jgi:hypothetical protein